MSNTGEIHIEIFKNNKSLNTIIESINFNSNSLQEYMNTLKKIQKNVNVELTKVVDQDKVDYTPADEDIEGLEDDTDDEITTSHCKRKLSSEKIKKKVRT